MPQVSQRSSIRKWFTRNEGRYAFTGTLKIARGDGFNNPRQYLCDEKVEVNVKRFIERLSRDILGRARVRNGASIEYFGAIEGSYNPSRDGLPRAHVHLTLAGVPADCEFDKLSEAIHRRWIQTEWGFDETELTKFETVADRERWIEYTIKEIRSDQVARILTNVRNIDE